MFKINTLIVIYIRYVLAFLLSLTLEKRNGLVLA